MGFLADQYYRHHCADTSSDIFEHLPVLRKYALECPVIVEMGVRTVVSTWALLHEGARVYSYDIAYEPNVKVCQGICAQEGLHWDYRLESTHTATLPEDPDFLFIDTFHSYDQVKGELLRHAHRAKRYIGFHDTVSFGEVGMDNKSPGIMKAITEFLEENSEWTVCHSAKNNNGLMILKFVGMEGV